TDPSQVYWMDVASLVVYQLATGAIYWGKRNPDGSTGNLDFQVISQGANDLLVIMQLSSNNTVGTVLFWTVSKATVPPVLPNNGIVNGASFQPGASPGAWISGFGTNLASQTGQAGSLPLPGTINGTTMTCNGTLVPLNYVSSGQ